MNKVKLLCAAILLLVCVGAKAQQAEQNPDYYIMGDYEIQNGKHYLRNVETRGITIDGQNYIPVVEGHFGLVESSDGRKGELTRFSFDKAKSNECDLDKGFYLQYLLEIGNEKEWVDEKEYLQGSGTGYSQKDMLVMLVLDYSTSMLRNDFISKMKEAAINFINTLATASPDGNVRVGIIAFSGKSQTQEFQIKNLDRNTKYEMERFIRSVQPGINTAYYYSIKRAVSMLEDYSSRSNLSRDNFNGACVVSFTDGLDNESADGENELSYIHNELLNKSIMGNTIEFYSIGFTGAEDFSGLQKKKFEEVIVKTATDANHSFNSRDIATIEGYFGDIARKLTDRWKIINLYTPQGHNGKKVRWVLRCGEPRPQPKPQQLLPNLKPVPQDNGKNGYFQITIGGAKPMGEFGYSAWEDNWPYCGLENNSEYGGAGFGITVGLQGKIGIRSVNGLGITISADGFFNGLNSEIRDKYQRIEDEYDENPSYEIKLKTPKYINSALMAGVNYEYEFSDAFKVFAGLGMGVNLRWITKLQENERNEYDGSVVYNYVLNYDTKMSFAYKAELGVVLGEKFVVSLGYFNLGAAKVEGTVHFSEEGSTQDQPFHLSKITPKILTFNVGIRF